MSQNVDMPKNLYLESYIELMLNFYKQILVEYQHDYVFCPLGLLVSLCIVGVGADGHTAEQIQNLIRIDSLGPDSKLHAFLQSALKSLHDITDIKLRLTNGMFVQNGFSLQSEFQKLLESHYDVQIRRESFDTDASGAIIHIDEWTQKATDGKIKNMVDSKDVDEFTRLILLTVVYFKSDWMQKFPVENTVNDSFHLLDGRVIQLPMMRHTSRFRIGFFDEVKTSVLELPYKNDQLAMVVLLPDAELGLRQLEETLDAKMLRGFIASLQYVTVNVKLPKFEIDYMTNLKPHLMALGMSDIFTEQKANLSRMNDVEAMYVSVMQQRTKIEIDETGSEAASATSTNIRKIRSLPMEEDFHADRPFLFYIYEKSSEFIIFWGRFVGSRSEKLSKDEL